MLTTALAGALIAISLSAPPGPVAMETIRRGLQGGFGPALRVQLGSIIGDLMWCGLALLGLSPLVQIAWVRAVLAVAGVSLLVYLGSLGIRDAVRLRTLPTVDGSSLQPGAFRSGLVISMANPMAVGYWLSVGGALIATGVVGTTGLQTAAFVSGFAGGTFAWAFAMATAVRWGNKIVTLPIFRVVSFASGVVLIAFGVALGWQMVQSPLF